MTALTFDTHFFVKKLIRDGIPEKQAETIVEFVHETMEADLNSAATKGDLCELKLRIQAYLAKLQADASNNKAEIIKWLIGALFLQGSFIITIIKFIN